jgi:hypothetical protein
MSDQDSGPRVWSIPAEPPVGTVVRSEDGSQRWRRLVTTIREAGAWAEIDKSGAELTEFVVTWPELLGGGQVVEDVPTPAEEQAAWLTAVAAHLRAHPRLAPVGFDPSSTMQIHDHRHDAGLPPAAVLLEWADSLVGEKRLEANMIGQTTYVYVTGLLVGGVNVTVWLTVPGFDVFLSDRSVDFGAVPLYHLAQFVESSSDGA